MLSRHDRKKNLKNISESSKTSYMYMHVWFGVRAPLDGRTCGRADGWTDGRTCNDIVLSHDRKRIFVKNISESRKNPPSARVRDFL